MTPRHGFSHGPALLGLVGAGIAVTLLALPLLPQVPSDAMWHDLVGFLGIPGALVAVMWILIGVRQWKQPRRESGRELAEAIVAALKEAQDAAFRQQRDDLKEDLRDATTVLLLELKVQQLKGHDDG